MIKSKGQTTTRVITLLLDRPIPHTKAVSVMFSWAAKCFIIRPFIQPSPFPSPIISSIYLSTIPKSLQHSLSSCNRLSSITMHRLYTSFSTTRHPYPSLYSSTYHSSTVPIYTIYPTCLLTYHLLPITNLLDNNLCHSSQTFFHLLSIPYHHH